MVRCGSGPKPREGRGIFFLLGIVVGSFLNVCIHRIPRGESLVFPPSRCPLCGHRLAPADLVPVLSYIWLEGRCRYCGQRISPRYPLVELATGLAFELLYRTCGLGPGLVTRLVLVSALLVVAFIDARHYRIPNEIVVFLAIAGVALNFWTRELSWWQVPGGAAVGGGILGALALLSRGGMGEGDVKLAAATGLYLGPGRQALAIFLAALFGAVVGGVLVLLGRKRRRDPIPFAPFLAAGTMVACLWGDLLWLFYLSRAGLA
ncbi:MAG: prepilin peptidase [Clostridia bacterium]|nr:prepilin peptidase [Clostridia bacterium]